MLETERKGMAGKMFCFLLTVRKTAKKLLGKERDFYSMCLSLKISPFSHPAVREG